jgi:hypothetical protein
MLLRALSILLLMILGGCSISGLLPDWMSPDVAGPEPAYRFLIANRMKDIFGDPATAGTIEISAVRRIDSLVGASWEVCLKAQMFPLLPRYYAVFIQRDRIVDSRLSVLIDQCELQSFGPFDWVADANNPPPPR